MAMIEVYSLEKDVQHIGKVQKASLGAAGYGFENTHGSFGSAEWWQQIESGKLQTYTICGIITRCYMTSMNDWPTFDITSDTGTVSSWTREVQNRELANYYRDGSRVELKYVIQTFRRKFVPNQEMESKCVLSIKIEDKIPT